MKSAVVVVTHECADDVEPYDAMWLHAGEHVRSVLGQCSRATIALWDAMVLSDSVPQRCCLRPLCGSYVIHINVFHQIASNRGQEPAIPYKIKNMSYDLREEMKCHSMAFSQRHSWFQTFSRIIYHVHQSQEHLSASCCSSVAFFAEEVVFRASPHNHIQQALQHVCDRPDGALILHDNHRGQRPGVVRAFEEEDWRDDPGRARGMDGTAPVQPDAFVLGRAALHALADMLARVHHIADANMVVPLFFSGANVAEMHPPSCWCMSEYLADKWLDHEEETIEHAVLAIQRDPGASVVRRADERSRIPRQLHQIWVGRDMPQVWRQKHEKNKRIHGAERVFLWGNADVASLGRSLRCLPLCTSHAMVADVMRLEILYKRGGYYVDTDFDLQHSLFALDRGSVILCREHSRNKSIASGFIACTRYNLFMLNCLSHYRRSLVRSNGSLFTATGGPLLIAKLFKFAHGCMNVRTGQQAVSKVPSSFLYRRTDYSNKSIESLRYKASAQNCFGIHLYAHSWI